MARTAVQYSKWMITIDGVQVPWIQFSIKTGVDIPGVANIVLEPDHILSRLRPKSMIHIWMYDEYVEATKEEDQYFLFWEGEVRGMTYSKLPTRSYTVTATGCLDTFSDHKIFMSGVGDITAHPIINGSALFGGPLAGGMLFNWTVAGNAFLKTKTGGRSPKEDTRFRHSNEINFSDRMLKLIVFFCQYNAVLRLHTVRSRLLNKIASVPDKTLGHMIPHILASEFFKQIREHAGGEETLLGLISRYNSYVFHHFASLMAPHFPEEQPPGGFDLVSGIEKDPAGSIYSFARSYYRNDYLILPETFYAIPPSCNLIFPEYIRHVSVSRNFRAEPTRAIITDNTLGSKLSVVVPDEILRFQKKPVEAADFWAFTNTKNIKSENPPQSPYVVPGTNINLLGAATDAEIEKGIITQIVDRPMHLFSVLGRKFKLDDAEARQSLNDRLGSILRLAPLMEKGGKSEENKDRAYVYTLKTIADYTLQLARLSRVVSVPMEGHRWLCPGFTAVIMDTDISYIGWVRSHTFSVESSGSESSNVELDYVRPMPVFDRKKLDEVVRTTGEAQQNLTNRVKEMEDRYSDFQAERSRDALFIKSVSLLIDRDDWEEHDSVWKTAHLGAQQDAFEKQFRRLDALYTESVRKPTPSAKIAISKLVILVPELKAVHGEVQKFFLLEPIEKATVLHDRAAINDLADRMDKILRDFYTYEQKQIEKINEEGELALPLISAVGDTALMRSKSEMASLYRKLEDVSDPPEDYPFPPVFANEDLMGVSSADEVYEKLLGAQKVFTRIGADIKEPELAGITGGLEGFRRRAFAKYAHFLRVLGKVFPITSPRAPDMDIGGPEDPKQTKSGQTEWEAESARDDSLDSVRKWEDRTFLRRTGLMSLGKFIEKHTLKLERYNSDSPTPVSFIVLAPAKTKKVGKFIWDNTIFSKIVDEFEDVPRPLPGGLVLAAGPMPSGTSVPPDSKIKELRESVKDPFLTTLYRQARLVKYSKKHFGSRGFDGS